MDKWVSKFRDGFCLAATRPQAALAEWKCPHFHQFRRSPLEWMEARNGGASAGYSHTAGERKVSYFQTQQQMDVSNIQSAQSTAAQAGATAAAGGGSQSVAMGVGYMPNGGEELAISYRVRLLRQINAVGTFSGNPEGGRDPGRRRCGLELVNGMKAWRFVVLSWVLIACFGLDGCALVILPAQIAMCASAPAGAGCQGMADLSAAEAGGRSWQ